MFCQPVLSASAPISARECGLHKRVRTTQPELCCNMSANLGSPLAEISEDAEDVAMLPSVPRDYAASKFRQEGQQVRKAGAVTASFKIRQIHKEVKAVQVRPDFCSIRISPRILPVRVTMHLSCRSCVLTHSATRGQHRTKKHRRIFTLTKWKVMTRCVRRALN